MNSHTIRLPERLFEERIPNVLVLLNGGDAVLHAAAMAEIGMASLDTQGMFLD